jgi:hypothetical protein
MERMTNLGEQIYVACYARPRYGTELAQLLYSVKKLSDVPQLHREITELEKEQMIYQLKKSDNFIEKSDRADARKNSRHYYYSNADILFDAIVNRLKEKKIVLDSTTKKCLLLNREGFIKGDFNEKERLKSYLDYFFRKEILDIISYRKRYGDISFLIDCLNNICVCQIESDSYTYYLIKERLHKNIGHRLFEEKRKEFNKWKAAQTEASDDLAREKGELIWEPLVNSLGIDLIKKLTGLSDQTIILEKFFSNFFHRINSENNLIDEYLSMENKDKK